MSGRWKVTLMNGEWLEICDLHLRTSRTPRPRSGHHQVPGQVDNGQKAQVQVSSLCLLTYVNLAMSLGSPVPQFLLLQNGVLVVTALMDKRERTGD